LNYCNINHDSFFTLRHVALMMLLFLNLKSMLHILAFSRMSLIWILIFKYNTLHSFIYFLLMYITDQFSCQSIMCISTVIWDRFEFESSVVLFLSELILVSVNLISIISASINAYWNKAILHDLSKDYAIWKSNLISRRNYIFFEVLFGLTERAITHNCLIYYTCFINDLE
jgi:hypothetical protein